MNFNDSTVIIGEEDVFQRLLADCNAQNRTRFAMLVDPNTYLALGVKVESLLRVQGWTVKRVMLEGKTIYADESSVFKVLDETGGADWTYLAVGSGTIHDIARYVSHRTRNDFFSLPTAASVDAYASESSSLTINGFKSSFNTQRPLGIYVYLPTLCAAPIALTTAGFGEMLGKFTALADWKLGQLICDEPYLEHAAQETWLALQNCLGQVDAIARYEPKGIRYLIEALIQAGFGMQRAGNPHPAGGSEHQLAYFWEINRLRSGKPTLLHGERVGLGVCLSAGYFAAIRRISLEDAKKTLHKTRLSFFAPTEEVIDEIFGPLAVNIKDDQKAFLEMDEVEFKQLKHRVLKSWPQIQSVAASVPGPRQISAWLHQVGAPGDPQDASLETTEVDQALKYSHLLRSRFTVLKLAHLLGIA